jgi:hypothetical protein
MYKHAKFPLGALAGLTNFTYITLIIEFVIKKNKKKKQNKTTNVQRIKTKKEELPLRL